MLRRPPGAWCAVVLLGMVVGGSRAAPAQERSITREPTDTRREAASYGSYAENAAAETNELDGTFRIDIQNITVTFDYYPDRYYVDGVARLDFVMRAGQTVPRFHFPPAERTAAVIQSLVLDGETIPFPGSSVSSVRVTGSSQTIFEINRQLSSDKVHTLTVAYHLTRPLAYTRFSTEVNDMAGHGNEEIFPTLNTPHELARHRIALRVHGDRAFRCIGSGLVIRQDDPSDATVQQWVLDTEREVASYTIMFVLMPEAGTDLQERVIDGIPVRILAMTGGPSITSAFTTLQDWLPRLQAAFGLYPAPRGLSVFLVSQGGGMEYFGGTISTPGALTHEVLHGYFACSVVMRTYRDSWLDEAITQWFDNISHGGRFTAISDTYRANWVGARSPVSVGYSNFAYSDGAAIIQALADRLGGTEPMRLFLRYIYDRYLFKPFTTMDFVTYFRDYSGLDLRTQFERWLYQGAAQASAGNAAGGAAIAQPEMMIARQGAEAATMRETWR
jgi:aminopeptidase N